MDGGGVRGALQRAIALALRTRLVRAYLRYAEHQGSMLADSITYRALFSVFAAVLLGFSLAALWLGGNPDALEALAGMLDEAIPGLAGVVDPTTISSSTVQFTAVGAVSLLGLVGAALSAVGSLRTALRTIADEVHDDGFIVWVLLRNLLVGIAFATLLVLAAAASVVGSSGIAAAASWLGVSASDGAVSGLTRVFGLVVVLAMDTAAVAIVFRLLSGVRAPARAFWAGSLLGGVGLAVLQEFSGLFVRGATSNPLLGTFAALIALLLWFNLSAQVILIAGAYIVTGTAEAHDRVRERYGAATLAQRRRLRAEDRVRAAAEELRAAREAEDREAGRDPGAE